MKTPYKRQLIDKKNALYIQIFPISQQRWYLMKRLSSEGHTLFFALV